MSGNERPDIKSEYFIDPVSGQRYIMIRSVSIGSEGGQGHNRELSAAQITALTASAAVKFTWAKGSRPKTIEVKPIGGACWVCFDVPGDPPDDATGLAWCQGASGEGVDSQRYLVPEYIPEKDTVNGIAPSGGRAFSEEFDGDLSNMYILEYSTALTALSVEAS